MNSQASSKSKYNVGVYFSEHHFVSLKAITLSPPCCVLLSALYGTDLTACSSIFYMTKILHKIYTVDTFWNNLK